MAVASTDPAIEEITNALSKDIPHIRWRGKGGVLDSLWSRSAMAFGRLLPLSIISRN
jgi:hypothetical protein